MRPFYDLIANIATEEFGHIELVAYTINLLLSGTTVRGNETPTVLWDAVVIPDVDGAVEQLGIDGRVLALVKDQYRHCKPILAIGSATGPLQTAGVLKRSSQARRIPACY